MDLVTHALTGAAISRVGLDRTTSYATATLVTAAVLPDIDALYWFRGSLAAFEHHRGFTHTLLGMPLMAAAALAIIWLWLRVRTARPTATAPRWRLLYLYALLGIASHLWLDLTLSYGLRPFAPFSYRWHSLDLNLVIEPNITLVLVVGLLASWLMPLLRSYPSGECGLISTIVRWSRSLPTIPLPCGPPPFRAYPLLSGMV
jgi:inner membrane protein